MVLYHQTIYCLLSDKSIIATKIRKSKTIIFAKTIEWKSPSNISGVKSRRQPCS